MLFNRFFTVYLIIGKTFNYWIAPFFTGILIIALRIIIGVGRFLDSLFYPSLKNKLKNPIIIVGNPRSGTTFLHRFLIKQKIH